MSTGPFWAKIDHNHGNYKHVLVTSFCGVLNNKNEKGKEVVIVYGANDTTASVKVSEKALQDLSNAVNSVSGNYRGREVDLSSEGLEHIKEAAKLKFSQPDDVKKCFTEELNFA